jgi:hypothetical protein
MFRFVLTAAIVLVLSQVLAGRAAADILQYESLDLAVARADLVVRGEVVELTSKKLDNGIVWNRVAIKVAETLKGEKVKEVSFLVRESPLEPAPDAWRNMRDELLFCLNTLSDYPIRGFKQLIDSGTRHRLLWVPTD